MFKFVKKKKQVFETAFNELPTFICFMKAILVFSYSFLFITCKSIDYKFACDLCDADYVGYTARHLHQRIAEHKYSSIGKHLLEAHGDKNLLNEGQFRVLKKCHGKFDCLVYETLFIQELKPSLNTQSDSISAKLFV